RLSAVQPVLSDRLTGPDVSCTPARAIVPSLLNSSTPQRPEPSPRASKIGSAGLSRRARADTMRAGVATGKFELVGGAVPEVVNITPCVCCVDVYGPSACDVSPEPFARGAEPILPYNRHRFGSSAPPANGTCCNVTRRSARFVISNDRTAPTRVSCVPPVVLLA